MALAFTSWAITISGWWTVYSRVFFCFVAELAVLFHSTVPFSPDRRLETKVIDILIGYGEIFKTLSLRRVRVSISCAEECWLILCLIMAFWCMVDKSIEELFVAWFWFACIVFTER